MEAVYINGRRFNHRVDSALVLDISQYLASGDTIAIHAVDFAGNYSNTVLLTPPPPALPPPPNNFTPDGQGEVLDHLTDGDGVEFITVTMPGLFARLSRTDSACIRSFGWSRRITAAKVS